MMPIRKITVKQFRGLSDQVLDSKGKSLNAIIGQNGSMKTTLLGIIAASFSIRSNQMGNEKTIDGKEFNTVLNSRFKFSDTFDLPGSHQWTIRVNPRITDDEINMKSYMRSNGALRFWIEGDREKGTTLIQCPVIYLSLARLSPIGEKTRVSLSSEVLSDEERQLFANWHNRILSSLDSITSSSVMKMNEGKNTLAPSTDYYDATSISAGQDNVGSIIMAVLSMKRLKERFPDEYKGGVICIDELESTLYPASQLHMIDYLKEVSNLYQIQFFFTTHSMSVIRALFDPNLRNFTSITYAKKVGKTVRLIQDCTIGQIESDLYINSNKTRIDTRIRVYCEDEVAREFIKALLGRKYSLKNDIAFQNSEFSS